MGTRQHPLAGLMKPLCYTFHGASLGSWPDINETKCVVCERRKGWIFAYLRNTKV